MPFTDRFTEAEWAEYRTIFRELGQQRGRFDANEATVAVLAKRSPQVELDAPQPNGGDIVQVLHDMVDLGYLRGAGRRGEHGPVVWEWVGD